MKEAFKDLQDIMGILKIFLVLACIVAIEVLILICILYEPQ